MKFYYWVLPLVVIFILGFAATWAYFRAHEYSVDGQLFRVDLNGQVQKPAGAALHAFSIPEGSEFKAGAEVLRIQRQMNRDKRSPKSYQLGDCAWVAAAVQRQYAETSDGVDPTLLFNSWGTSVLEEWQQINRRADFVRLSEATKRRVRRAFWLRRVFEGDQSNARDAHDDAAVQELWEEIFKDEISKGTIPLKYDKHFLGDLWGTEERLQEGMVEHADSEGRFALSLKRGSYLLVGVGDIYVPNGESSRDETVVWLQTIRAPYQGRVVIAQPFCQP